MPYKCQEKRREYRRKYLPEYRKTHPEVDARSREKNREATRLRVREYRNQPGYKEKEKWKRIEKKYGLTKEQWEKIYKEQDGKCYLCLRTEKQIKKSRSKFLVVDHNHETGEIRGLICSFCNSRVLVSIKECPDFAIRLHTYLTRETNYGVVPSHIRGLNGSCEI